MPELLYDQLLEATYETKAYKSFREAIIRARKFILDDEMSSFMTDLAQAAFLSVSEGINTENYPEKRAALRSVLGGARNMARLPFDVTWVEFNANERTKRFNEEYLIDKNHIRGNVTSYPRKAGWLLVDRGSGVVGVTFVTTHSQTREVVITPYEFRYSTEDTLPSGKNLFDRLCPNLMIADRESYHRMVEQCTSGIFHTYSNKIMVAENTLTKWLTNEQLLEYGAELKGELRYVFTTLATINDIPVTVTEVENTRGFRAKSNGPYMRHSTVTIAIPKKREVKKLARRVVLLSRIGRHEVRGHWRRYGVDRIRKWVMSFERGDAALGWVGKKYVVKKIAS